MGATTIVAPPSSSKKEALLIASSQDQGTATIGFTYDQSKEADGKISFTKGSDYKEYSMNFDDKEAFIVRNYDDCRRLFKFQMRNPLLVLKPLGTAGTTGLGSDPIIDRDDIELIKYYSSGSGLQARYDKDKNIFFEPMGYATSFSLGNTDRYWDKAYVEKPFFKYSPVITSDQSAKEQIECIDSDQASLDLLQLRPVSYVLKGEDKGNDAVSMSRSRSDEQPKKQKNYGLIAQEVINIFPDIVELDTASGQYGIRYMELIPILIATLQRQQQEIDALKELIAQPNETKSAGLRSATGNSNPGGIQLTEAMLWRAVPNPFADRTTVQYFVPEDATSAYIALLDLQGGMIESYPCTERGQKSSVQVSSDNLANGIYLYTLVVDGVEIATYRLVVKK